MDKVIRSLIVLFVLLIAITGYHKSYDQSYNASTINNLKEKKIMKKTSILLLLVLVV